MENLNELKPVGKLSPFAHFCCTIGNLPASYMISLTYEEQLLWLCNYLEKTVIPAVNTNAEAVAELQNLYIQLKEYVDNYFTNLDVQTEINNKLDEMAQSGELEEIIAQYINLNTSYVFDTINDLKNATNLIVGSKARTLGFYTKNDGGGAYYTIREVTNQDTINNYSLFAITNSQNLVAELFSNNNEKIKISQLGIQNDINTILKYAITNYNCVDVDKNITIENPIIIENTDNCLIIESSNKSLITCQKTGFIIEKSNTKIKDLYMRNNKNLQELENNKYSAILIKSSHCMIDGLHEDNFYYGINLFVDNIYSVFCVVENCFLGYNVHSGIYCKALSSSQKNSIVFKRNYINKNGKDSDNLTSAGDTNIGYGIYISGGINIKTTENVVEYNTNVGIYVEKGYALEGYTSLNDYAEQNKRSDMYLKNISETKNINILGFTSNRPKNAVSNAYDRLDIMLEDESISQYIRPNRKLNIFGSSSDFKNLLCGNGLCPLTNLNLYKEMNLDSCFTQKSLINGKPAIKSYTNYNITYPIIKNATYKMYIKFDDSVVNPNFGFCDESNISGHQLIPIGTKNLTNHIFEITFTSNYDCNAVFYQEGENIYPINYISLTQVN